MAECHSSNHKFRIMEKTLESGEPLQARVEFPLLYRVRQYVAYKWFESLWTITQFGDISMSKKIYNNNLHYGITVKHGGFPMKP